MSLHLDNLSLSASVILRIIGLQADDSLQHIFPITSKLFGDGVGSTIGPLIFEVIITERLSSVTCPLLEIISCIKRWENERLITDSSQLDSIRQILLTQAMIILTTNRKSTLTESIIFPIFSPPFNCPCCGIPNDGLRNFCFTCGSRVASKKGLALDINKYPSQILIPFLLYEGTWHPGSIVDTAPSLPPSFIADIIERIFLCGGNNYLSLVFRPIVMFLLQYLCVSNLTTNYMVIYRALQTLICNSRMASFIAELPSFLISHCRHFSSRTILGSLFYLSSDHPVVAEFYWNGFDWTLDDENAPFDVIRNQIRLVQSSVKEIVMTFLKSSESREKVLNWISIVLDSNKDRAKMQTERHLVSSDGFFLNLCGVMLDLCEPFIKDAPLFSKLSRVESAYSLYPRFDMLTDTRLAVSTTELKDWIEHERIQRPASFSFITESFFLTLRCLHLGFKKVSDFYVKLKQKFHSSISELSTLLGHSASRRDLVVDSSDSSSVVQLKENIVRLYRRSLAIQAHLFEPTALDRMLRLYILLATWILRQSNDLELPVPDAIAALPEYAIENAAEFIITVSRENPEILYSTVGLENVVLVFVRFIACREYVTNPYLRSKLVDALFSLTPNGIERSNIDLSHLFTGHKSVENLAPALIALYVDAEHTGGRNEFYDKFNIRYHIALLLRFLWDIDEHRLRVERVGSDLTFFLKFAHMLMSDATYLLDEELLKMQTLRITEATLHSWATLTEDARREKQEAYERDQSQARSLCLLAAETLHMVNYMTKTRAVQTVMLQPEMIDCLAGMLNYYTVALTGPRCNDLKVRDPQRFSFDPVGLLVELVEIYLNFKHSKEFKVAVVRDSRSFSDSVMQGAVAILKTVQVKTPEKLMFSSVFDFESFVNELLQVQTDAELDDSLLGDIPDEFLDPIYSTLMKDPVILPSSKQTVDRSVIGRYLLSEQIDPFNRQPLTIDQVIPDVALKTKIDEWLVAKRQKKLN